MKSEVFTNRFEVEKMAEDIFVCDDKPFIYIDYADLRTLRRISTLKYGISFKISCSNNKFIEEILYAIKSQDIPLSDLKTYLINIRINEDETSLNYENIGNLLEQQIRVVKPTDSSEDYFEGLWTLNTNSSIPLGECYINLIFGFNKTAEDQLEDEKHEQMIEEYHIKLPPVEWDFSELNIEPKNEN